jgi:hypothetical protein
LLEASGSFCYLMWGLLVAGWYLLVAGGILLATVDIISCLHQKIDLSLLNVSYGMDRESSQLTKHECNRNCWKQSKYRDRKRKGKV